jgi:hypothetical protein
MSAVLMPADPAPAADGGNAGEPTVVKVAAWDPARCPHTMPMPMDVPPP